jgi:hypothetical protein
VVRGGDREGGVCRDIHELSCPFGSIHISELLQEDLDLLPIRSALGDQVDALQDTSKVSVFSSSTIILHRPLQIQEKSCTFASRTSFGVPSQNKCSAIFSSRRRAIAV